MTTDGILRATAMAVFIAGPIATFGLTSEEAPRPRQPTTEDLQADTAQLLRGLPGVAQVKVSPASGKPARRLVHLLDWHFVPRELLAVDFLAATGHAMTDADYDQHLDDVEAVQREHTATLAALTSRHGLRRVFVEGLTEADLAGLPAKLAALREAQSQQAELASQLAEARTRHATGGLTEHLALLLVIETDILGMPAAHRRDRLRLGAAFALHLAGRLDAVAPLDDAGLLEAANPVQADGTIRLNTVANDRREDAMVSNALKAGPVAVIVCGGSHDLAAAVRRIAGQDCEYARVASPAYLTRRARD
jgi:hypothetical protein